MKHSIQILALFGSACVLVSAMHAQSYTIDWFTIDGGGGTSTGGVYTVSGTIGQPDAGASSGGNYSLIGGFWGAVIPVQTPGAPTLFITPTGTNVTISWLPNTPGFVLQQVSALTPVPIGWANAPAGCTNGVTIPAAPQTRYFRLIKPRSDAWATRPQDVPFSVSQKTSTSVSPITRGPVLLFTTVPQLRPEAKPETRPN